MSSSSSAASDVSGSEPVPAPHVVENCLGIVQLLSDGTVTRSTDYSKLPLPGGVPSGLPVQWKDVVYDATHALRLRHVQAHRRRREEAAGARVLPWRRLLHRQFRLSSCPTTTPARSGSPPSSRRSCSPPTTALRPSTAYPPRTTTPRPSSRGCAPRPRPQRPTRGSPNRSTSTGCSSAATRPAVTSRTTSPCGHGSGRLALDPLRLAGCIMLWPYFGGEERVPSEAAYLADDVMGTALFDQMWRLALPAGATRDHPAANPLGPGSVPLDELAVDFPPVLVVDPDQDSVRDRVADYVARLKAAGKPVELVVFAGQGHGFFVMEPCGDASDELIRVIRRFVHGG